MPKYLKLDSHNNLTIEASNKIGYKKQKSFKINIGEIKIAGLKCEIPFDDEELYICFIDKNGISNNVNSYFLNEESIRVLKDNFGFSEDYFRLEFKYFEEGRSLIFFPKKLKGQELYKKWNTNLRTFANRVSRFFHIRYAAEGILSDVATNYLQSPKSV